MSVGLSVDQFTDSLQTAEKTDAIFIWLSLYLPQK